MQVLYMIKKNIAGYFLLLMTILFMMQVVAFAESGRPYRKSAVHKGNLVKTVYGNWGVVGQPAEKGPRGAWIHENNGYIGDVSPLIGAEVSTLDTDGNPVTFRTVIVSPISRPTLGGNEESPTGERWGFEPVSGYDNPLQGSVAMSNNPTSWPPFWPDIADPNNPSYSPDGWAGSWNGYFGKEANASEESYYVMDDANDKEFNFAANNIYGVDFKPDSTNLNRSGLGLEVRVRGMQWGQFLAQDIIFWLYEVTNTSTTDYSRVTFGALVGTYVGVTGTDDRPGEYDDDWSFFDVDRDLTFTGDYDNNVGRNTNWVGNDVGMVGYAFLESPGNPVDGIDNDRDAVDFGTGNVFSEEDFAERVLEVGESLIVIDEDYERTVIQLGAGTQTIVTRGLSLVLTPGDTLKPEGNEILLPNPLDPSEMILQPNPNAYDGIDNDLDGLIDENYNLHYRQVRRDQDGNVLFDVINPTIYIDYVTGFGELNSLIDERRDDGEDNDGDWSSEFDDVGTDGVAGTNDADGTEGNGWPDEGEPNFDSKDPDESDQIGLTSFNYFAPAGDIPMKNDEVLWDMMAPGFFDVPESIKDGVPQSGEDGDFIYSSGYFPLQAGQTERFSIGLLYGEDITDLLKNLETVKDIYDSDYRFPSAPLKPTLGAVPGDGEVTLYWDRRAEESIDPVLKIKDFEGYKIYRATDPNFNDIRTITNSLGVIEGYDFLEQFDLINDISGPFYPSEDLFEQTDGYTYYLGTNSGIQHTYTDSDVLNGRTYYYAVVAYDRGDEGADILPSENTKFISVSPTGEIFYDINTVGVTPGPKAPGYTASSGEIPMDHIGIAGTGSVDAHILDQEALTDHVYFLTFKDQATDGIDNDGDWDPGTDDVGSDGIAGTNDANGSEGDGIPQNGEPNVEFGDPQELNRLTTSYSILDSTGFDVHFNPQDTIFVQLDVKNVLEESVKVYDHSGNPIAPGLYQIRAESGAIQASSTGSLPDDEYRVTGQYYPVFESPYIFDSPFVNEAFDSDIFDGIELVFQNQWDVVLVDSLTGWNFQNGYGVEFGTTIIDFGNDFILRPVEYPSDYEIVFFDSPLYVANDSAFIAEFFAEAAWPPGDVNKAVNFKITNTTESYDPFFYFFDADGDGNLTALDQLFVFDQDSEGNNFFTWNILFLQSSIYPDSVFQLASGDSLFISTMKPFREGDVFRIQPDVATIDETVILEALEDIKVFPNPYVSASAFEAALPPGVTTGRGERRVTFTHVPYLADIHIYTVRGNHIKTITADGGMDTGMVTWNLKSKENLDVAYGIYFWVVDTPHGHQTGKLAIIK